MKVIKTAGLGLLALALIGSGATAASRAKIGMAKARAIALKIAPGAVQDAELEKENGGWRYSFDIVQGGRVHEIGVDAFTGKIVKNGFEKPGSKD